MLLSLLAQTLDDFMQIQVKALGHRKKILHANQGQGAGAPKKKILNRLSCRAPFDSFINLYLSLSASVSFHLPLLSGVEF